MANTKTPTQKEMFNEIIALAKANNREDIVEFAEGRIAVLANKSAKVNTKKVAEVEANTEKVYEALANTDGNLTVSELIKVATNEVAEWNGQKVSAYLKKLVEAGRVTKTTEKKVSRFSVA